MQAPEILKLEADMRQIQNRYETKMSIGHIKYIEDRSKRQIGG